MVYRSIFTRGDTVTAECRVNDNVHAGARGVVKDVAPYSTMVYVKFDVCGRREWVREDMIRHTFATVESDNG